MTSPIEGVSTNPNVEQTTETPVPTKDNPLAGLSMTKAVGTLANLKHEAPALWSMMMESVGWCICKDNKRSNDHLIAMMKEDRRNNSH